jgi:hypothetical protein
MVQSKVGARSTRRQLLVKLSWTVVAMLSGCQTPQKLQVTQSGVPKFDRFRAEYRFEQADQLLVRNFDASSETVAAFKARQREADKSRIVTVATGSSWSIARLELECPHPNGDEDLALLTLTLSDRHGPNAVMHQDIRQLTTTRSKIELLIGDLARQGYFDQQPGNSGQTQLAVQIDRGRTDRNWVSDARLLDLAHQTLSEGTAGSR